MTTIASSGRDEATHLRELGRRALELIDGARKALAYYPPDHPLVVDSFRHLEYVLGDMFIALHEVTISVLDGEFYLNEFSMKRETATFRQLAEHFSARRATSISFFPQVDTDELRRLFVALQKSPEELEAAGWAAAVVDSLNLPHVRVRHRVATAADETVVETKEIPEELKAKLAMTRDGYDTALSNMRWVFENVGSDDQIDYRLIKTTTEALLDSVVTNRNVWSHLLNVKHTDEYSYNHSVNVTALALLLATRFGVRTSSLPVLAEAALLHDLGKQKVPAEILQKPAALSDDEWAVMRSHPEKGAKILLGMRDVSEAAIMVAYEHHIRYDHKGYPPTRGKRELHLFSHLVAVADIYDALTSDRGYRKALLPDMAMRIIVSQSATAFHPLVVKHFVNLVGIFPVGTFIQLKSGEIGMVHYNQSRDLLRPVVLLVSDADGQAMRPVTRDLSEQDGEPPIKSCIDPAVLGLDFAPTAASAS